MGSASASSNDVKALAKKKGSQGCPFFIWKEQVRCAVPLFEGADDRGPCLNRAKDGEVATIRYDRLSADRTRGLDYLFVGGFWPEATIAMRINMMTAKMP